MHWLDESLHQARQQSLLRIPITLQLDSATQARLDGRDIVVFCGNDYLGLRFDPRLIAAAADAARTHGTGTGASRLVSGNTDLHDATEEALASLVGQPAALLTSSGFAANVGAIPSLMGPEDAVFSDALNHASIVDGCRLSRARVHVYAHADVTGLADAMRAAPPYRRAWVITESLFSMDGDIAPLAELRSLCDREGAYLYVDDAHALGVYGPRGQGAVADAAVTADVLVGTLGKALGSGGAFIAGSKALRLYLWNQCRSFVFSTGLAPPTAAAAREAARIVPEAHALRAGLQSNIQRLREGLRSRGIEVGGHARAPIVPLLVGDEARAVALSRALLDDGIFVQAIRPPTVPRATARLRITVTAAHRTQDIDKLVETLARRLRSEPLGPARP